MKKLLLLFIVGLFFSCKKEEKHQEGTATKLSGEAIFTKNNCASCHKVDLKVVGPSLQEIAKIYTEKKASMVSFLKEETPAIVDEKMYETMKINLQITKQMSDEELKSLEDYILSFKK